MVDKLIRVGHILEDSLAYLSIFLLALFPFLEVIARKFFHTGIPNSTVYVQHLVLVLTLIAGAITSKEKKHLSLILELPLRKRWKSIIKTVVSVFCGALTLAFAVSAFSFALGAFDPADKIGPFPKRLVAMSLWVGFSLMGIRFIIGLENKRYRSLWLGVASFLSLFFALAPLCHVIERMIGPTPAFLSAMQYHLQSFLFHLSVPLIIALVVAAFFGAPIFVVLGGIGYLLFARLGQPLEIIPNQAFTVLTSHSIPAIPLFAMVGFFLSESKAGERLVRFFQAIFCWFPGGLPTMAVLVCAFFTTFTGASGVTIVALGGLLVYILVNGGYKKKFSVGLLTASGSVGLLFPPSLPVIIYGVTAGVNIKDMFLGGLIPGGVMVFAMVAIGVWYSTKNKVGRHAFRFKEAKVSFWQSILEIVLPFLIAGLYLRGITNLVESAAVAIVYIWIVETFIKGDLRIKDVPRLFSKCVPIIGGVLIILALANGLSFYIIDAHIPTQLTAWIETAISSKYIFLLLLNVALLVVGCFMDIYSAILVVVPLIIPLGALFRVHPVHLGVIFLANLELGYLTPPVGLNLFLASYRFNEPMARVYQDVLLFLWVRLGIVLFITYLPFLVTAIL